MRWRSSGTGSSGWLPLPCFLFEKPEATPLFLGDSPLPAARRLASAGVCAIWAPPAAPSLPRVASRRAQGQTGAEQGRPGCPSRCGCGSGPGRTEPGTACCRSPGALLVQERSGDAGGQPGSRGVAPEALSPGCAERGAPASSSQLPPGSAVSAREKRGSLHTPPQAHRASFHLIRMFLPFD